MTEKQILGFNPAPRLEHIAISLPSACRIANIALNDAMILPHDANPHRMEFSERTEQYRTIEFGDRGLLTRLSVDDLNGNGRHARKVKNSRGSRRQVDHASMNEWATIIDSNHHRLAIALICDLYPGTERQRAMCGSQNTRMRALATRGLAAFVGIN